MLMRYFVPSPELVGSEWGHLRTCHTFCFFFSWCAKACVWCHLQAGAREKRNESPEGKEIKKSWEGGRKMSGGRRECVKVKPGHCKEKSITGNSQCVKFSIEGWGPKLKPSSQNRNVGGLASASWYLSSNGIEHPFTVVFIFSLCVCMCVCVCIYIFI